MRFDNIIQFSLQKKRVQHKQKYGMPLKKKNYVLLNIHQHTQRAIIVIKN